MSEIAGAAFVPCQHRFLLSGAHVKGGKVKVVGSKRNFHAFKSSKSQPLIKNVMKTSNFCSRITIDLPLYESPEATFDEYLNDRSRVFQAICPDNGKSQRLNEEEWRIEMLPLQFLFMTALPVMDMRMRLKSQGKDYPPGVPLHATRVLLLDVTRWELQGLDGIIEPSHFKLGVRGTLYPDRNGIRNRLKGAMDMNVSIVPPTPMLLLVPEKVFQGIAESMLKRLTGNMKHKANESLFSDFSKFKREILINRHR